VADPEILKRGVEFEGVWGTEVPQRGPGQSPGRGLGVKPPEAKKHDVNFVLSIALVNAWWRPFYFS